LTKEIVHSVYDYWDRPQAGAANFDGSPHWYEAVFDKTMDEWSGEFDLTPLTPAALDAEIKADGLFQAWNAKFKAGLVGPESHPKTARDPESMRLRAVVDDELRGVPVAARMKGRFEFDRDASSYVVEWTPPGSGA
jgi:hypothetical protein